MAAGHPATVVVLALAFDALIGDPDLVWRKLPHPVAWMGAAISQIDRSLNNERWSAARRRATGCVAVATLVSGSYVAGLLIEQALGQSVAGLLAQGLIASIFVAQRSLYQHVDRVRAEFAADGLAGARRAVSMIVGRETGQLDASGVSRAAIESCAENFSDGVVAPAFWLAILGLPGLLVYKAVNTADSMIGHRTIRHESFGWAAARLDDLLNLVPARLAALILALVSPIAGGSVTGTLKIVWRDASMHRSPNAGWPESAMAGALGLALAGPRQYGDKLVNDPFLNAAGRLTAEPGDIRRALNVLIAGCMLEAVAYAALALVV
ncbi:adenosylcobinamide-phosphate synthase CbiB [Bradyrhizobium lablabi]|uniref:adenosylcobinamide-phosphate synthase CbiB n=1 Tax=Bradyrhizobium lablabi TaxID=722472 RepID=UPI001BA56BF0|nr:adenosylcobinamide-phosphate synthase CbiB [Bradyrhizobium lablabi]MBR0698174.1 cobalamin biosynthesis protein [Bradyrhizobium lablabi]